MMLDRLQVITDWSIRRPKVVFVLLGVLTILLVAQAPRIKIDTDPENMLERDQPDRVFYDQVRKTFGIYDYVVVGITGGRGMFTPDALARVAAVTDEILQIEGVIASEVISLSTTDNVTGSGGDLDVHPLMTDPPETQEAADRLKREVLTNPLFSGKLASADGTGIAVYIPMERKDVSYRVSREAERILKKHLAPEQKYSLAGLPIAEDTFGFEMFFWMGLMMPIVGVAISLTFYLLFRRLSLIWVPMMVAMVAVAWTMGLLIGSGMTVHIMSSMIPVFLMPIAVCDSVHILSEFYDLYPGVGDRAATLRAAMRELWKPMYYTSITSAVGFGAQVLAPIPPVQVFGGFMALGIMLAWVLTVSLVPAYLMTVPLPATPPSVVSHLEPQAGRLSALSGLAARSFASYKLVLAGGTIALILSVWGVTRLNINDNPVKWFRPNHRIRVADRVMNSLFGGTYMAYLVLEGDAPDAIKRPEVMGYIAALQDHLQSSSLIGKTTSVADIVRRVNLVLYDENPGQDRIPDTLEAIGQNLFLYQMAGDPDDLDNFVDTDFRSANIWVQMKKGDNRDMSAVQALTQEFISANPPPSGLALRWSGLTYINKVWQGIMVIGMLNAVLSSFAVVFILMMVLFRSLSQALVSLVPVSVAIVGSYGLAGWVGKEYDMPVAVCSSLALGIGIDYAIHFIQRFRQKWDENGGDLADCNRYIAGAPARAILRNTLVIFLGFLPLLMSTLTPYVTVGAFFGLLMVSSALASLLLLPAFMRAFGARILGSPRTPASSGALARVPAETSEEPQ
jgi:predicted RND superfamily exporter protein